MLPCQVFGVQMGQGLCEVSGNVKTMALLRVGLETKQAAAFFLNALRQV